MNENTSTTTPANATGNSSARPRYRRRVYVVNRRFQLKYTIIITIIGGLISAVLGTALYKEISKSTEMLKSQALSFDPSGTLLREVQSEDIKMVIVLVLGIGAIVVCLLIWGILMTHRVAGPLFIITRYTNQIADGIYPSMRPLRKNDELHDFFEAYKEMVDELIKRDEKDYNALTEVAKNLQGVSHTLTEAGGANAEVVKKIVPEISKLEEVASRKAKRLNRG